jgi:Ca2+:H+ antiporter
MSKSDVTYGSIAAEEDLPVTGVTRILSRRDTAQSSRLNRQQAMSDLDWFSDRAFGNQERLGVGDTVHKSKLLLALKKVERLERWKKRSLDVSLPSFNGENTLGELYVENTPGEQYNEIRKELGIDSMSFLKDMIFGKYINILLLFLPLGYISHIQGWNAQYIFWFNFLAMVPLASILGDFTEALAAHTNETIGGLINATFGNAVEVVVAIQALLNNEIRVVQASMIGSIFSNLLLVLGCCFFFGGLRYKEQTFNTTATTANMSLLGLSSMALVLPTPFAAYYESDDETVLQISRASAIFLMAMYLQMLVFQLKTHSHLMASGEEETPEVSFWIAMTGLVFVTLLIAVLSDFLVESIDEFVIESGISRTFVGLVILPIVGNAVEHITAISVAMKNKMDLAMGGESFCKQKQACLEKYFTA